MEISNDKASYVEEDISFIRPASQGELNRLLKKVNRTSVDAVEFLTNTMNDDKADIKVRVSCAKELVAIHVDVAKIVNQDNLQRMVAQLKLKGNLKRLVPQEEDDNLPVLNFETVQTV